MPQIIALKIPLKPVDQISFALSGSAIKMCEISISCISLNSLYQNFFGNLQVL